ncbi:substrate-binding periplasmic protein [Piscirickettsia litoralis]|uniref:substrate-binding periplasmic protein n=1 Tax=Piscirickettsia litoralis TaxID=1891921 RepID=UPI00373FC7D0
MTTPMGFNKTAVFVREGYEFTFKSWEDLKGKRVGMVQGVSMGQEFDTFVEKNTLVDRVSSRKQNYDKLAIGRIDLIATGLQTGLIQSALYGYKDKIVPLPHPIHPIENGRLYISMSKQSKYIDYLKKAELEIVSNKSYPRLVNALLSYYTDFYVNNQLKNNIE